MKRIHVREGYIGKGSLRRSAKRPFRNCRGLDSKLGLSAEEFGRASISGAPGYRLRRDLFLGGVKAFLRGFENLNRGRKIVFLEAPRHGLADLVITSRG